MVTGTKFVTVPYRGSALALPAMIAGDVDIMFDNLGSSLQLVKEGRLKMLAVATDKRMPSLPDLPTRAETLPGFVSSTWVGVFLPPETSAFVRNEAERWKTVIRTAGVKLE
jgi:tripartite-type tricarboxylate transporter receptor subunit TctC